MQLKSIGVLQTAKVVGVLYFIITGVIAVPLGIFFGLTGHAGPMRAWGFFAAPFVYGVVAFVGVVISAWIYNQVADWVGGIEVELS